MAHGIHHRARLGGADYFFVAVAEQARRAGVEHSLCRTVVELTGDLEQTRLNDAIVAAGLSGWRGPAELRGHPPWSRPCWQQGPVTAYGAARFPIDLSIAHSGQHTSITLSWDHGRMDARGADLLLARLDAADAGHVLPGGDADDGLSADSPISIATQLRAARWLGQAMAQVCRPPMLTLARKVETHGAKTLHRVFDFDAGQTERARSVASAAGGRFFQSTSFLAAAMLAIDRLRRKRGVSPGACVVHVPYDLRRVGATGPIFANALSFLLYRAEPSDLSSLDRLVSVLKNQMTEQLRTGAPEKFRDAMHSFLRLPLGAYARALKGSADGQVSTFCFSDVGQNIDLTTLFGLPVRGVVRFAPVPYPPGIQLVMGRSAGCLSFVLSWVQGCLSEQEAGTIEQSLRATLGGGVA